MKCREIHNAIYFFIINELSASEAAGIRVHIDNCEACRNLYEHIKVTHSVIEKEKRIETNPFFYTRLQQRIKNEEPVYVRKPSLIKQMQLVPVVILIIVGLAAGILLGNNYYNSRIYAEASERSEKLESLKNTFFSDEPEVESLAYSFYNIETVE